MKNQILIFLRFTGPIHSATGVGSRAQVSTAASRLVETHPEMAERGTNRVLMDQIIQRKKQVGAQVIAITGASGSGKTTVGQYLKEKGLVVVETDSFLRSSLPEPLKRALIRDFGPQVINQAGGVNKLVIFKDRQTISRHDRLAFPFLVKKVLTHIREALDGGAKSIFVDSAYIHKLKEES